MATGHSQSPHPGDHSPNTERQGGTGVAEEQGDLSYPGGQGGADYPIGQGVPGHPGGQGVLGHPGGQGVPGWQGVPDHPGWQGVPGHPGWQGVPGLPGGQGVPGHPGGEGVPAHPVGQGVAGHLGGQAVLVYPEWQGVSGHSGGQEVVGYPGEQGGTGYLGEQRGTGYLGGQEDTGYKRSESEMVQAKIQRGTEGGRVYLVQVKFPQDQPNFLRKVEKYFTSTIKSGGEENCKVSEISPTTYYVYFYDPEAYYRVLSKKDHKIENIPVRVTSVEDMKSDELHNSRQTFETSESSNLHKEVGRGNDDRGTERPVLPEGRDQSRLELDALRKNYLGDTERPAPPESKEWAGSHSANVRKNHLGDKERPAPPESNDRSGSHSSNGRKNDLGDMERPAHPESNDRSGLHSANVRKNHLGDTERPAPPESNEWAGPHSANVGKNDPTRATRAKNLSTHPSEIFGETSTTWNRDLIHGEILEEIKQKFPYLKISESKVRGSYKEINELHDFLNMKLGGEEKTSLLDEEPGEELEDCLNLQTPLYDYITDIYKEDLARIRNRYNVDITEVKKSKGTSYIKLKPLGPESLVERANQYFIDKVQAVTKDWSQNEAPLSAMKGSLEDTKQYMKEHHKTLVIVEGDRLILRGPERELTQAMEALLRGEGRSVPPRKVITISPKDRRSEVLVDARHLDILKKLKLREIEEIQEKFRVKIVDGDVKDRNVNVTFRSVNGAPDLGAHACHHFTNLLQSTIMNLQRKTISGNLEIGPERLDQFITMLQNNGIDVILECDKDSVTLIASPILVDFAEEKFNEFFKTKDGRKAAGFGSDMEEAKETDNPANMKDKQKMNPANTKKSAEEETCPICLDQIKNKKVLPKCKHEFCDSCLQKCLEMKPVCPVCTVPFGTVIGNQPNGTMNVKNYGQSLPGYHGCGTIQIDYNIPGGVQQENHPNPGKQFSGTHRTAYLPDNREGREVLRLLRKAFDQKLIFTVGESRTTGATDTVTWNDIHHKTNVDGGPAGFGYPDPDYLKRVRDELKAKGVE